MVNGISNGSTNSEGKLTLQGNALTSGNNHFVLKNGTNDSNGSQLASVTLAPISLANVKLISNDMVLKGEKLPITAKINASISDLSGYKVVFSGAITGTYTTDKYGQATINYTATGTGSKSVTVTAGNWSATKTFNDYVEYWNTTTNYVEHSAESQGFTKLAQYYKLDTSLNNIGYVVIGEENIGNWELSFKVINQISDIYFDISAWKDNQMIILNVARQVSFSANDVIKATCNNGTITVTKNNVSLYSDSFPSNHLPMIFIRGNTTIPTSVNVGSPQTLPPVQINTLTFNELKLKAI